MKLEETASMEAISIRTITKMSICVALCCVAAYISFPLPFTTAMITALTIAMNLAAFILTPKQTFIVMLVYTLLGCIGLPVFVGGTAGLGKVFGPTGGFILAFIAAYPMVSYFKGKTNSLKRYILVAIFVGIPITYIGGLISMLLLMDVSFGQAMIMAVFPFIPGDILKSIMAALIGVKLNKVFEQWG